MHGALRDGQACKGATRQHKNDRGDIENPEAGAFELGLLAVATNSQRRSVSGRESHGEDAGEPNGGGAHGEEAIGLGWYPARGQHGAGGGCRHGRGHVDVCPRLAREIGGAELGEDSRAR